MAKQKGQSPDWSDILREIISRNKQALAATEEVERWLREHVMAKDVLPHKLPPDINPKATMRYLHNLDRLRDSAVDLNPIKIVA